MTAEISTMRLDINDIQEALMNHDSWREDVWNTLQQMQDDAGTAARLNSYTRQEHQEAFEKIAALSEAVTMIWNRLG